MRKPPTRPLTDEEKQLWHSITQSDTRLNAAMRHPPAPVRLPPLQPYLPPLPSLLRHDAQAGTLLSPGDYAGIDRNTANQLRKGDYPIDATLDLHGMTREKAYQALHRFIAHHHARHSRCLLIITGKGARTEADGDTRGVLRGLLPQWLEEPALRPLVLALDAAKPRHGGTGAYYLLLKRQR
jgi:DNA-nicking Smr family endonuclease